MRDQGLPDIGNHFWFYRRSKGRILHESAPYTPQTKRISERANRTTVEMARSRLAQFGLCKSFWMETVNNVVSIRNRLTQRNGQARL